MKKAYPLISSLALLSLSVHAADITQTTNDGGGGWNSSLWNGSTPTGGNNYITASGFTTSDTTRLGAGADVSGRVRAITGQGTFAGDSLEIVTATELLIKNAGPFSANITLNGGVIRHSPNSVENATLSGSLNVAAESYIGVVQNATTILTVNSTLTGGGILHIAAGNNSTNGLSNHQVVFGGDLSGFSGTFDIGGGTFNGGNHKVIADFSGLASSASMTMGDYATVDFLNLSGDFTIGSFAFNGSSLSAGTYTIAELNTAFGTGSQFTGTGDLTVIPEPSTFALIAGGLALGAIMLRRRKQDA